MSGESPPPLSPTAEDAIAELAAILDEDNLNTTEEFNLDWLDSDSQEAEAADRNVSSSDFVPIEDLLESSQETIEAESANRNVSPSDIAPELPELFDYVDSPACDPDSTVKAEDVKFEDLYDDEETTDFYDNVSPPVDDVDGAEAHAEGQVFHINAVDGGYYYAEPQNNAIDEIVHDDMYYAPAPSADYIPPQVFQNNAVDEDAPAPLADYIPPQEFNSAVKEEKGEPTKKKKKRDYTPGFRRPGCSRGPYPGADNAGRPKGSGKRSQGGETRAESAQKRAKSKDPLAQAIASIDNPPPSPPPSSNSKLPRGGDESRGVSAENLMAQNISGAGDPPPPRNSQLLPPGFDAGVPPPGYHRRFTGSTVGDDLRGGEFETFGGRWAGGLGRRSNTRVGRGGGRGAASSRGRFNYYEETASSTRTSGPYRRGGTRLISLIAECTEFYVEKQAEIHNFLDTREAIDCVVKEANNSGLMFGTITVTEMDARDELIQLNALEFYGAPVRANIFTGVYPTSFPRIVSHH